jgi:hypothetical protein
MTFRSSISVYYIAWLDQGPWPLVPREELVNSVLSTIITPMEDEPSHISSFEYVERSYTSTGMETLDVRGWREMLDEVDSVCNIYIV